MSYSDTYIEAQIAKRRADKEFLDRLERTMEEDKDILRRLANDEDGGAEK